MVSYRTQMICLILGILICISLIVSIFHRIEESAVREMNERQMIYARMAAKGIESFLADHITTLTALAGNPHIIDINQDGKELFPAGKDMIGQYIQGITRVSAGGEIIYTYPVVAGAISANISGQAHVREILLSHKVVVSDIFKTVQGFESVAIHVPVYRTKAFDGTIALLISFDELAKGYLDDLYIPGKRYALLINPIGKVIHCTTPEHQGHHLSDIQKDKTESAAILRKMAWGADGESIVTDHYVENGVGKTRKMYAVYAPVRAGNGFWSVAVLSSEELTLPAVHTTRYQIIILAVVLIVFFALAVYTVARIRGAGVEAQKRQKIEEDLIKSAQEIHDLYHNAPCGYHSLDRAGNIVRINDTELSWLGYTREELVGKSYTFVSSEASRAGFDQAFDMLKQQGRLNNTEYELRRKDGTTFPVFITASAVTDPQGNFVMSRSMVLDMTLHRRQEELLRESEALYRTALETTSDGISIIDVQAGRYLYANQRLMNTIGRPAENIAGQPVDVYLHPEDADVGRNKYQAIRASGKGRVYYELRAEKPDGSIVMLGVTATETIYQGKAAVISFITDVTEQKRTEDALRESEELYRTAIEKTNDGISIVQDGKFVFVNQKLLKTIGRTQVEVINQALGSHFHPDDSDRVREYFVARIQGKEAPASYDIRVMKSDGTYVTLNVKAVRITYKRNPATISFITDITEQKRAEEALRQSEERYRTIFESIDDDYFETDLEGIFTFLNRPVSWTQFRRDELIGTKFDRYVPLDIARKIRSAFNTIYQEDKSHRIPECEIILKDGTTGHLEMSASLIRDAGGLPAGFRGVMRDVSERFAMEAERRKLMEQLHQAQKMEAVGTLAGGIAHDFNNLLMGIQGYTSLMLLETDPTHPYFEQLKAVQTLVQSGAGLTRQLLGFARAGRYEVLATDLNDLVSKSINLFGRTRKEIRIFEKYEEHLWSVEVDRGQIEQVLLNLFVNAWQAMPGGGSLYIETNNIMMEEPRVTFYDLKCGRYVKISITDTGVGMDEKTRQRIFDPFFTTKEMGRGTGLGLASAYGIVKGHAGVITVDSERGQGATFTIYLPASSRTIAREESAEIEPAPGHETILLVDDEEVITDVTGRLLRELGYTITTADNGEEAIKLYTESHADIDLVIIDMIMPGISGSDTFDRLKAVNPSVRAILSSGYSLNGKAQDIINKGVRAFLQKPYRLSDLARKIREVLAD